MGVQLCARGMLDDRKRTKSTRSASDLRSRSFFFFRKNSSSENHTRFFSALHPPIALGEPFFLFLLESTLGPPPWSFWPRLPPPSCPPSIANSPAPLSRGRATAPICWIRRANRRPARGFARCKRGAEAAARCQPKREREPSSSSSTVLAGDKTPAVCPSRTRALFDSPSLDLDGSNRDVF